MGGRNEHFGQLVIAQKLTEKSFSLSSQQPFKTARLTFQCSTRIASV